MGKKEILSEEALSDVVLSASGDVLCIAVKLLGFWLPLGTFKATNEATFSGDTPELKLKCFARKG